MDWKQPKFKGFLELYNFLELNNFFSILFENKVIVTPKEERNTLNIRKNDDNTI